MVAATDSADSSLHVGPPRHAASPHPTNPSCVSRRTKTKFTASRVVKDMWWGRRTGMSARTIRTSAILLGIGPFVERSARTHRRASGATREAIGIEDGQIHR